MPHATKTYQDLVIRLITAAPVDYRLVPRGSLVLADFGVILTSEDATVFPKGWGTLDGRLVFAEPSIETANDPSDEDILTFPKIDPKPVHHLPPGSFDLDELLFQHGFESADIALKAAAAKAAQEAPAPAKKAAKAKKAALPRPPGTC